MSYLYEQTTEALVAMLADASTENPDAFTRRENRALRREINVELRVRAIARNV